MVLGYSEILERLNNGEIFKPGTWARENLRSTGYDLRMAIDFMIVPDPPEAPTGRRYDFGQKRTKPVILNTGDVAFISTVERLALPWNISANVGNKFSIASQGIIILSGLIVDPGAGLQLIEGKWIPKENERLHFLMANLGPDPVVFLPGQEKIAALQFFLVEDPVEKVFQKKFGADGIRERFFDHQTKVDAGLEFFRNVITIRENAEKLREETKIELDCYKKEIDVFGETIKSFEKRLGSVESGSNQIVFFGVYLLSTTILGVSLSVILSLITHLNIDNTILLSVGLVLFGILILSFLKRLPNLNKK